jgi:hypothetical protein
MINKSVKFKIVESLEVIFEALAEDYVVKQVGNTTVRDWMIENHYLHRVPAIQFAFGLFKEDKMVGACTYAPPPVMLNKAFQPFPTFDLNRIALVKHDERNLVSYFISQTLKQFPVSPAVIVSYADPAEGHAGYIYQALNFVYTGKGRKTGKFMIDGQEVPYQTMTRRYGTQSIPKLKQMGVDVKVEQTEGKHRYFTFVGDKRQRRDMLKLIQDKYEILGYPKI